MLSQNFNVGMIGFEPTISCPPDKCVNLTTLHPDHKKYIKIVIPTRLNNLLK